MGDLRGYPPRPADSGIMMRHRPGLDGLRGLAVVAVLAYHLDLPHTSGGFLGVSMFFALSGYLITALVLVEVTAHGRVDWYRFAGARFRRLLPALIVCVLVAVVAGSVLAPSATASLRLDALTALDYLLNWRLVVAHVPYGAGFGPPSPLLHLWSLAVEGQLYLFWAPVLGWLLRHHGRRQAAVVALLLVIASTVAMALLVDLDHVERVYYGTDTRAAEFLVGAALALCRPPRVPSASSSGTAARRTVIALDLAAAAALAALLACVAVVTEFDEGLYRRGGFAGIAVRRPW